MISSTVWVQQNILDFPIYFLLCASAEVCILPVFFFVCVFIYLGFYVTFNTVQVISQRVVGRAEETSTCSLLGFCTINCRPTASNYQLSHLRLCRESNPGLRGRRRECYHSATVAPSCLFTSGFKRHLVKMNSRLSSYYGSWLFCIMSESTIRIKELHHLLPQAISVCFNILLSIHYLSLTICTYPVLKYFWHIYHVSSTSY